jgi:hypothetical protein
VKDEGSTFRLVFVHHIRFLRLAKRDKRKLPVMVDDDDALSESARAALER